MADEMMRIAGRSPNGVAKAIQTDPNGKLAIALAETDRSTAQETILNYVGKTAGSVAANPNIVRTRGAATIILPDVFAGTEFSNERYIAVSVRGDAQVASTNLAIVGQFPQQLYTFDVLNALKIVNKIPLEWTVTDLKQNVSSIELTWVGRGTDINGNGAAIQIYNAAASTYTTPYTHNLSTYSAITVNVSTSYIDNAGMLYVNAHTINAHAEGATTTIHTDYIEIKVGVIDYKLKVRDAELHGKVDSIVEAVKINNYVPQSKVLTANVLGQVYTITNDHDTVVVQNTSKYAPVEIIINDNFIEPTSAQVTPNPDDFTNVIRLRPLETIRIKVKASTIAYRSTAGSNVKIKITTGFNVDAFPISGEAALLDDAQVYRFAFLCNDRNSEKVFATSSNFLYFSSNGGKTYVRQYTGWSVPPKTAFYTRAGTLIVSLTDAQVFRSTDDGVTFTKVLDAYGWRGTDGIFQDSVTGAIIFGENEGSAESVLRLMRSTDDGLTWNAVLTRTNAQIRHWHSVQMDMYTGEWIATSGDTDAQVEWWKSSNGTSWTCIVGGDSGVPGSQMYRTLGLFFTQDEYVWASDNPLWGYDQNFVCRVQKDDPSKISKSFPLPAAAYAHIQLSHVWIMATQPEGYTMSDRVARVYVSYDEGRNWKLALEWEMAAASVKGGFTWGSYPDSKGRVYMRIAEVQGQGAPWYYGTLGITI